jgi:hypothetical protein
LHSNAGLALRRLVARFIGADGRRDERCPDEDQGERRDAHTDHEGVIAEIASEDGQSGEDRGQVGATEVMAITATPSPIWRLRATRRTRRPPPSG